MVRSSFKRNLVLGVLGLLMVLGPYQNCALHESDGRKQFEKLLLSQTGALDCSPYLMLNEAALDMEVAVGDSIDVHFANGNKQCVISTEKPPFGDVDTGLEVAVCDVVSIPALNDPKMVTADALNYLVTVEGATQAYDEKFYFYGSDGTLRMSVPGSTPPEITDPDDKFFGAFFLMPNDKVMYVHYNVIDNFRCSFKTITKALYDANPSAYKAEAAKRGSRLTKSIYSGFHSN